MTARSGAWRAPAAPPRPPTGLEETPIKTTFLAFLLVLALRAQARAEAPGVYLSWNDCAHAPAATQTLFGSCAADTGSQTLVCAFVLPEEVDSVLSVEGSVDLQASSVGLPDWWQLAPDGCRYPALTANASFAGSTGCADFWAGDATLGGPPVYLVGEPHHGTNQAGIRLAFAVASTTPRTLSAGVMYYAAKLVIQNTRTSACFGCAVPTCIILNTIRIGRIPDPSGEDNTVTVDAAGSNQVTWQSAEASCSAVRVATRTWGQLKVLYR